MDLDLMTHGQSSRRNFKGQGRRPLDNAERERRKKDNLCYNCGKSGHRARDCRSSKPMGLHVMSNEGALAGSSAKKADTDEKTQMASEGQGSEIQETLLGEETTAQDAGSKGHPGSLANRPKNPEEPKEVAPVGQPQRKKKTKPTKVPHEIMSWTACYNDDCAIHRSSKEGATWWPQKKKRSSWKGPIREESSDSEPVHDIRDLYIMRDDRLTNQEDEEVLADDTDDESDSEVIDARAQQPYCIITPSRGDLFVITNYWRYGWCNQASCPHSAQHTHPVFDTKALPKEFVRRMPLTLCRDCARATDNKIHTHCWDNNVIIPLDKVPEEHHDTLWRMYLARRHEQAREYQRERITAPPLEVDNRYSSEYPFSQFPCQGGSCEVEGTHVHLKNIDPLHPKVPLHSYIYKELLTKKGPCEDLTCGWRVTPHTHVPRDAEGLFSITLGSAETKNDKELSNED